MLGWLRDRVTGRQPRPVPVPWPEPPVDDTGYWCLVISLDQWRPTDEQRRFWDDWVYLGRSRGLVRVSEDRYELPCGAKGTAIYWSAVLFRWCGMSAQQVRHYWRTVG